MHAAELLSLMSVGFMLKGECLLHHVVRLKNHMVMSARADGKKN
jgi:hypothetical protein